jgi:hypothetical protein
MGAQTGGFVQKAFFNESKSHFLSRLSCMPPECSAKQYRQSMLSRTPLVEWDWYMTGHRFISNSISLLMIRLVRGIFTGTTRGTLDRVFNI